VSPTSVSAGLSALDSTTAALNSNLLSITA
jgi:hypothetical protein